MRCLSLASGEIWPSDDAKKITFISTSTVDGERLLALRLSTYQGRLSAVAIFEASDRNPILCYRDDRRENTKQKQKEILGFHKGPTGLKVSC